MDVKRVIKGSDEYGQILATAKIWWDFWKFTPPAFEYLPQNMLCAYNEDGPACIGFMYMTDSKLCWLEWIVADPKRSKADRNDAIQMILSSVKILSSALGFSAIFTSSKNQSLNNKLEKKYQKTDEGVTHFVGRV